MLVFSRAFCCSVVILVSRGLGSQAVIIGAVKLGLSQAEQMGMACLNLNTGDGSQESLEVKEVGPEEGDQRCQRTVKNGAEY